jgi:hypothetical protein
MSDRTFKEISEEILEWFTDLLQYLRDDLGISDPKELARAVECAGKARLQTQISMRQNPEHWEPCNGCGAEWFLGMMGGASRSHIGCIEMELAFTPVMTVRGMTL